MSVESAKEYRQLAAKYRGYGFNLVPLGADKRPAMTGISPNGGIMRFRWDDWQQTKQTDPLWAQIKKHEWWVDVGGLGGVCGPVSGDMVCIDFDTPKDRTDLVFPFELVEHFLQGVGLAGSAWLVDSPRGGYHVWARCPGLEIEKGKLDRPALGTEGGYHIELRWTGHYAALPESQHPNGVYAWHNDEPLTPPPTVDRDALLTAYAAVTKEPEVKAVPATVHVNGSTPHVPGQGYAAKALDEELQRVRSAASNRNDTLNRAAYSLGQLVGAGLLGEGEVEQALLGAASDVGLGEGESIATIRSGLRGGIAQPRVVALNGNGYNGANGAEPYLYGFTVDLPDALDLDDLPAVEQAKAKHNTWPYTIKDGRICLLKEDKDGDIVPIPVASFTAHITGQIEDEDGSKTFIISGEAVRGGPYTLEHPAERFGKDGELRAALESAVGPYDPVYNRMSEHLVPAIKILTTETDLETIRRFRRTGWIGGKFLMPGMAADKVRIELPDKLAYRVSADADLDIAKAALINLIECVDPAISTPILTMLLQAPLHRPAGWQNERYGVFIQGRTGSLKTSFTQTGMSIYGAEFSHDRTLIKLGEGSTRNAIMAYAASAHDMPLFIDNYKPNTGFGFHDLVNLIHNILEGGEKDRLTRTSTVKDSRPVHCFPIITGEDVPDHDPATLARLLLIAFEWQAGQPNEKLALAQMETEQLSAIGLIWLQWICSEEGQRTIKETARFLPATRDSWASFLRSQRKDMVNILRVATNIATNELTWSIALQHPVLGELFAPYSQAHGDGLRRIAENMAKMTTEALEAVRFLSGLRELLATGQATLIECSRKPEDVSLYERDRMVGWQDDEGVYLLPTVALERIRKVFGAQSIPVSLQVLYSQFEGLKLIAAKGRDKVTRSLRVHGEVQRVLHLVPAALTAEEDVKAPDEDDMAAVTAAGL
jgi:hypothetical protein